MDGMQGVQPMILPEPGRGTAAEGRGGGGSPPVRKPEVYAARKLRRDLSLPEAMLWKRLKGQQCGFKVRRQHPIGPYVVDFYAREGRLVVEVDGEAHNAADRGRRDAERDRFLGQNGYRVLHVPAAQVLRNLDGVLEMIVAAAESPLHQPSAGPPPRSGEDL